MAKKRSGTRKPEAAPTLRGAAAIALDDSPGALARLKSYAAFELDRRGNEVRDDDGGLSLTRVDDELFFSRTEIKLRSRKQPLIAISSSSVREVRLSRHPIPHGGYELWKTALADYAGNTVLIATTRDPEASWEFTADLARLLNVPLTHGEKFHRRIPPAELKQSLWQRADSAPLDVEAPTPPPGTEVKELDGAIELSIRDARQVSPVLGEWAKFGGWMTFLSLILTLFASVAIREGVDLRAKVTPAIGALFFLWITWLVWKQRPRPRVVETKLRVTTEGQLVWNEKAGGRSIHNIYDLSQYLDLSTNPAYLVSIDGEERFPTRLDPHAFAKIGDWLERAIIYCRAIQTGRRRQTLLEQTKVDDSVSATERMKRDPVPVKVD